MYMSAVHVQSETRYEVYIRVQYIMYSANKKEKSIQEPVPVYKEEDQNERPIYSKHGLGHLRGSEAGGGKPPFPTKGNTAHIIFMY